MRNNKLSSYDGTGFIWQDMIHTAGNDSWDMIHMAGHMVGHGPYGGT